MMFRNIIIGILYFASSTVCNAFVLPASSVVVLQQQRNVNSPARSSTSLKSMTTQEDLDLIPSSPIQDEAPPCSVCRIVTVAPNSISPFNFMGEYATWKDVMDQVSRRVSWNDPLLSVESIAAEDLLGEEGRQRFDEAVKDADVFFATHVTDGPTSTYIATTLEQAAVPTRLVFNSGHVLQEVSKLGEYSPYAGEGGEGGGGIGGPIAQLLNLLRYGSLNGPEGDRKLWEAVSVYYNRMTPEDMVFILLTLVNGYVRPVEQVVGLGKKAGLKETVNIITKCGKQVAGCINDPTCKKCLDCLESCPPNDQVCAYRCITSYESAEFEQFALCILQKHNCMGNSATIPMLPKIAPMSSFGGQPMTAEMAEDLFIGWLGKEYPKADREEGTPSVAGVDQSDGRCNFSWKVVAGLNAAYDQFNCQFQIFYRGRGSQMWYDPVFSVSTLDGERVWRRRHYRVKRAEQIGTFRFSVLDNGVTSNEFWRIVHVEEDLSWGIFYYSGAAAAAGQSYSGALVVTADGNWPSEDKLPKVKKMLKECGIEPWEMYSVHNKDCGGVTKLGIPKVFVPYNKLQGGHVAVMPE